MNLTVEPGKQETKLPKVMEAALKLFVEKGIEGTSIRDIASKARVSEGALYRHFKGKNELAWYLFSTHLNQFTLELMDAVNKGKDTKNKIHIYISTCFESFEGNQQLFNYLILSEHRELKKFPPTAVHPGHVALKILQEGQKNGSLRKMDIYVAASILVGSLIRLCVVRMYEGTTGDLRPQAETVSGSLWDAIKSE